MGVPPRRDAFHAAAAAADDDAAVWCKNGTTNTFDDDEKTKSDFHEKYYYLDSSEGGGGTTKGTTNVVKCKVHDCDGICRNKYQIRSRTCGKCLNAKEVFVEKEDAARKRFCQKCTRFHAVTEFEGARKACVKSLKKVAERNSAKKQKTPPRSAKDRSKKDAAAKRKTTNDANVTENKSKSSGESNDTLLNECDDSNYKQLGITKLEPSTMDTLHALIEKERLFHPVDRVDRLVEAIKAKKRKESLLDMPLIEAIKGKKRKESLLDMPLISDPKKAKMMIDRLPLSERESEEFQEEFDDDDELFEDDGLEKERKNRKNDKAHGDGDNNRKKVSKNNELMSLLQNTVRSVTPSLYRGAMEAKFKEFFGSKK